MAAGGRHQLTLLLPPAEPVADRLRSDVGESGNLSNALPVGRSHPLADRISLGDGIGRVHVRRQGPKGDGLGRVDYYPDVADDFLQ